MEDHSILTTHTESRGPTSETSLIDFTVWLELNYGWKGSHQSENFDEKELYFYWCL